MNDETLKYTIIIQAAEEGGYVAFVPSLPGCMTQGETVEEARENIKDAIEGYLQVLKADGDAIPIEKEHPLSVTVQVPLPA